MISLHYFNGKISLLFVNSLQTEVVCIVSFHFNTIIRHPKLPEFINYRNEDGDEFFVTQTVNSKPKFRAGENGASKGAVFQHSKGEEHETSEYGFLKIELPPRFNDV